MSSTDTRRPRSFRATSVAAVSRAARVGAVVLAVTATLPLAAQTARAETAPGEPTCLDVGAAELGRDGVGRVEIGDTGLVLVRDLSAVSVEGDGAIARSVTVIREDGVEQPGWDAGTGPRNELNMPTYDHVRVCWEEPVTTPVQVPETTPTTVPWTQVEPPVTVPWTDLEEPVTTPVEVPDTTATTIPWTQVDPPVPTKRSTATHTEWTTILTPTGEPATSVDRKRPTPTEAQESTTPVPLARPEVLGGAQPVVLGAETQVADSSLGSATAASPATAAQPVATAAHAEAPAARLAQSGTETMPLVVAGTSLVVLGGAVLRLSRPSKQPAAPRRSAR